MRPGAALPAASAVLLAASAIHALVAGNAPAPAAIDLAPDTPSPVRGLVFQVEPSTASAVVPAIVEFVASFDRTPEVHVVVERAEHAGGLAEAFAAAGLAPPGGLRIVEVGRPITTWSKDRTLVARTGGGWTLLVGPDDVSEAGWTRRVYDRLVPSRLVASDPRFALRRLPFRFDGGDFLVAGNRVVVDWNLLGRNPEEVETLGVDGFLEVVARAIGREVVLVGDGPGSVPNHHIGMYLTAADARTILVGDPRLARGLLGARAATVLPEGDLSEETAAMFDRIARGLEAKGFRVVRLPLVPWRDRVPIFVTYDNVVLSTDRAGSPVVHMPVYGIAELDGEAEQVYRSLGLDVRPVDMSRVYRLSGSLRCLPEVLR